MEYVVKKAVLKDVVCHEKTVHFVRLITIGNEGQENPPLLEPLQPFISQQRIYQIWNYCGQQYSPRIGLQIQSQSTFGDPVATEFNAFPWSFMCLCWDHVESPQDTFNSMYLRYLYQSTYHIHAGSFEGQWFDSNLGVPLSDRDDSA